MYLCVIKALLSSGKYFVDLSTSTYVLIFKVVKGMKHPLTQKKLQQQQNVVQAELRQYWALAVFHADDEAISVL